MLNQIHELQIRLKDLKKQLERATPHEEAFLEACLVDVEAALDREIKAAAKRVAKAKARKDKEAQLQAMYSLEARARLKAA